MKLKDYIHYYYGCEFIANGMRYTIDRIDRLYIINNYSFCSVDMPMNEKKFAIEIAKRLINQMPVAHYLLQRHFDLFGLIDAGLAVDGKTL